MRTYVVGRGMISLSPLKIDCEYWYASIYQIFWIVLVFSVQLPVLAHGMGVSAVIFTVVVDGRPRHLPLPLKNGELIQET